MIIFVRNLVVNDFWLKLFSLVLAVLIWFTVHFSINKDVSPWTAVMGRTADEAVVTVPVNPPLMDGRAVSVIPQQVQVTLKGDPKELKELRIDDVHAQVNLADVELANGLRRPIEMILPQGIAYTHLVPPEVEVRVSEKK